MVTNSLKKLMGLACILALMAGCATTSEEDTAQDDAAQQQQQNGGVGGVDDRGVRGAQQQQEQQEELDRVFYFDYDSSVLNPEARAALSAHAERFKNNSQRIRLEGHADERGSREYNMALGERRANAAADYLVLQGIPRSRIETVSYGEERPARMGSGESAWEMNRRVELK